MASSMANAAYNNMKEAYTRGKAALKAAPQGAQWIPLQQGIAQKLLNYIQDAEGTWTSKLEEAKRALEESLVVRKMEVSVPRLALYAALQYTGARLQAENQLASSAQGSQASRPPPPVPMAHRADSTPVNAAAKGAPSTPAGTSAEVGASAGSKASGTSSGSGRGSTNANAGAAAATGGAAAGAASMPATRKPPGIGGAGAAAASAEGAKSAAAKAAAAKAKAAAAAAAAAVVPPQNDEEMRTHQLRSSARRQGLQLALKSTATAIRDAAKKEARNSVKEGTSLLADVDFELEKVEKGYQSMEDSLRRTADMHSEAIATCQEMLVARQRSTDSSPFDFEGTLRAGEETAQEFRKKAEKLDELTGEALKTRSSLCDQLIQLKVLNTEKAAVKMQSEVVAEPMARVSGEEGADEDGALEMLQTMPAGGRSSVELLTKLHEAQDECSMLSEQSQSLRAISEQLAVELRQVAPRVWKNQRASKHVLGLTAQLEDLQLCLNMIAKEAGNSKEQAIVVEACVLRRLQVLAEEVATLRASDGLYSGKDATSQEPPLKMMRTAGGFGLASSLEDVEREELRGKLASTCSLIRNAAAGLTSERIWQITCSKQAALRMKEQEERAEISRILDRQFTPGSVPTSAAASTLPPLPALAEPPIQRAADGLRRPSPFSEIAAALEKCGSTDVLVEGKMKELLEQSSWVEEEKIELDEGLLKGAKLSAKAGWITAANLIAGAAASAGGQQQQQQQNSAEEEESWKRKAKLQELQDKKTALFEDLVGVTEKLRNNSASSSSSSSSSSSTAVGSSSDCTGRDAQEEVAKMAELIQQQVFAVKARASEILKGIPVEASPPIVEGSEMLDSRSALDLAENSARVAALHRELQAILQQGKVSMQAWAAGLRCERATQDLELASSCREVLKSFVEDSTGVFSRLKASKDDHRVLTADLEKLQLEGRALADKRASLQAKCADYDESMALSKRDLEATESSNKEALGETPSHEELSEALKKAKEAVQAQKERNRQLQLQFGTFKAGGKKWSEIDKADKDLQALQEKIRQDKLRLAAKRSENAKLEKKSEDLLQVEDSRLQKFSHEVGKLEAAAAESKKKLEELEELKKRKEQSLAAKKQEWQDEEAALKRSQDQLGAQAIMINRKVLQMKHEKEQEEQKTAAEETSEKGEAAEKKGEAETLKETVVEKGTGTGTGTEAGVAKLPEQQEEEEEGVEGVKLEKAEEEVVKKAETETAAEVQDVKEEVKHEAEDAKEGMEGIETTKVQEERVEQEMDMEKGTEMDQEGEQAKEKDMDMDVTDLGDEPENDQENPQVTGNERDHEMEIQNERDKKATPSPSGSQDVAELQQKRVLADESEAPATKVQRIGSSEASGDTGGLTPGGAVTETAEQPPPDHLPQSSAPALAPADASAGPAATADTTIEAEATTAATTATAAASAPVAEAEAEAEADGQSSSK